MKQKLEKKSVTSFLLIIICSTVYTYYISFLLLSSTIKHRVYWLILSMDHRILRCYNDRATQEIDITQRTPASSFKAVAKNHFWFFLIVNGIRFFFQLWDTLYKTITFRYYTHTEKRVGLYLPKILEVEYVR